MSKPTNETISPRTGKPMQKQLGKSKKALELRAKKIAKALIEGQTQEQALLSAGYSKKTARGQAAAVLGNPVMQETFYEILEKTGLSDEYIASKHKQLIDATRKQGEVDVPDYTAVAKGLDLFYKVRGRYVEKKEISGNDGGPIEIHEMTDAQLLVIAMSGRGSKGDC